MLAERSPRLGRWQKRVPSSLDTPSHTSEDSTLSDSSDGKSNLEVTKWLMPLLKHAVLEQRQESAAVAKEQEVPL